MRRPTYGAGLAIAFFVQVGLLGWIIAERALLLMNGTEVQLNVIPVDPRDLLRGDYIVLSYAISRLRNDRLAGTDDFGWGDTIYVTIERGTDGWHATAINRQRPAGGLVLKGTIDDIDHTGPCQEAAGCRTYTVA